jgi:hypothetical protein
MTFPHPKSRKDKDGKEEKPNRGGVVWNLFKRTVDITEDRNAEDDVNPAKNRTLGGIIHDWFLNLLIEGRGDIRRFTPMTGQSGPFRHFVILFLPEDRNQPAMRQFFLSRKGARSCEVPARATIWRMAPRWSPPRGG